MQQTAQHSSQYYSAWADVVLMVHFGFVAFVVLGLVLIWVGYFRQWSFVRNFWFRAAHLACIGVVAAEAIGGVVCPLTKWEAQLRWKAGGEMAYAGSFMQYWIHKIMFFEIPESTFTFLYIAFFLCVLLSFWFVRPRFPWVTARRPA
jgi:hypothetical protein